MIIKEFFKPTKRKITILVIIALVAVASDFIVNSFASCACIGANDYERLTFTSNYDHLSYFGWVALLSYHIIWLPRNLLQFIHAANTLPYIVHISMLTYWYILACVIATLLKLMVFWVRGGQLQMKRQPLQQPPPKQDQRQP